MDAATIISAVITQSGTDASRPTITSILNERYAEQVAKSQWWLLSVPLGPTVANQAAYPLPANPPTTAEIVEIVGLKVGGYPWDRIGQQEMWQLQAGSLRTVVGRGGVFAPDYAANGAASVVLYPTPTASGIDVSVIAACLPPPLFDNTVLPGPSGYVSTLVTPTDLHGSLIDGASSTVLRRIDERSDLAASYETTFLASIEELRRRKNSLARGRGPVQIQVAGYQWDNR